MVRTDDLPSIASASMLGSLNISFYVGRKKDKGTEVEVQHNKGAGSSRAASVYKNLFAESAELKAIISYAQECRQWFNKSSIVWDDNGTRIIPTASFFEVDAEIEDRRKRFFALVSVFVKNYDIEVSKQAFMLGALFDRDEFPTAAEVAGKFDFRFNTSPMPLSGHFALDMSNEAVDMLAKRYEADATQRVNRAVAELFGRVKEHVEHIRDRVRATLEFEPDATEEVIATDENGNATEIDIKRKRRPKLYQSLLDNGIELCGMLHSLNITKDPELDEMRAALYDSLVRIDIDSLRKSPEMQESVKKKMDSILDKFSF